MARPDPQDSADIERVLAGDAAAFEGLVARHGRRVHDVARRMLRDPHEAEDATQQAFLNAYKALARFDRARPFRHWILRITTNLCRNRIAKRQVRRQLLRPTGGEELPPPTAAAPAEPGPAPTASLRDALDALPDTYRLAMILRYVHELPLDAIAEVTGVPVATVKTHLHRGRAALRRSLTPETPDADAGTGEHAPS